MTQTGGVGLNQTKGGTAVVAVGIGVVAELPAVDHSVSTDAFSAQLTSTTAEVSAL